MFSVFPSPVQVLQDRCLRRGRRGEVSDILRADLGRRPEQLFSRFDEDAPVAAASLAQVFRATTHDGRVVAVKAGDEEEDRKLRSSTY